MKKKLLPNDGVRDIIDDGIKSLKSLKPTGNLTFSTMSQQDYDNIMSLLLYLKSSLSRSRPFCKECRAFYGLTISMECIKCKHNAISNFSILRKSDFKNNYRQIRTVYKGTLFKDLIPTLPPVIENIVRIDNNEPEEKEEIETYPSLGNYLSLNPTIAKNQDKIRKLKEEILRNSQNG